MKKFNPVYLALVFLVSAVLFVACSKEAISDENTTSQSNLVKNNQANLNSITNVAKIGKCVSIGLSYGFISISTEVCCWRWTPRSPTYACSWGSKKDYISIDEDTFKGYIDVEQLGSEILKEIDSNNLKKLKINKSLTYEEDGIVYKVKVGDYLIEKDEIGRFIKVDISIKQKNNAIK